MAFKAGRYSSITQPLYCTLVQLPSVSTHKLTALNLHRVQNVNILCSKWHNGFCIMTLPNHIKICPKDPKAKTVFKLKTFTLDHNTTCLINQFALFKWISQINIKHSLLVIWFRFRKQVFYCNDHYNLFNRF